MKIYDTATRRLVEFPQGKDVKMYVCGVTVYDEPHLGHARAAVVFDAFVRYLRNRGYNVKYVTNFTDIDDKIINRANEEGRNWKEVAEDNIRAYFEAMDALKVKRADVYPKATEHIPEMIDFVQRLIDKGYAYQVGESVYFDVRKFKEYGKLSGRNIDDMLAEHRVSKEDGVRFPLDFALWKGAKPGEPWWEAPWGKGRPGWHLECSVMILKHLGETIDLHGGGKDLIFPHHENEIAQSEAHNGVEFVRSWMHIGLLRVANDKMSKSLKNFMTIRQALEIYDPYTIRLFLLSTSWRQDQEFSVGRLEESARFRYKLAEAVSRIAPYKNAIGDKRREDQSHWKEFKALREKTEKAFENNFNTPEVIASINEILKLAMRVLDSDGRPEDIDAFLASVFWYVKEVNDIVEIIPTEAFGGREVLTEELVNLLVDVRNKLRKNKHYDVADFIRDGLAKLGIALEDAPSGTRWYFKV